jgi:hypothetical protein
MIEQGATLLSSAIETTINQVEKIDKDAQNRPVVFGSQTTPEKENQIVKANSGVDRLKVVSGELLDLWLYEGVKSLEYIKQSRAYQLTDPYVNYVEKFESVKQQSVRLTETVQKAVVTLNEKCVIYYDEATKFVGMLLQTISSERRGELIAYVKKTYSNVVIYIQEQWVRLDFNEDGKVDIDDLRKSLQKFYEFLREFDYIQASQKITSAVYGEAQRYLQSNKG